MSFYKQGLPWSTRSLKRPSSLIEHTTSFPSNCWYYSIPLEQDFTNVKRPKLEAKTSGRIMQKGNEEQSKISNVNENVPFVQVNDMQLGLETSIKEIEQELILYRNR
jgi:hypothetical protein